MENEKRNANIIAPFPEIVEHFHARSQKKYQAPPRDPFQIQDTNIQSAGGTPEGQSYGRVDIRARIMAVPLVADAIGIRNHEMAHFTWSPVTVPSVDFPSVILQACEDARIHLGLCNLGLSTNPGLIRSEELREMQNDSLRRKMWVDVILRCVGLSFTDLQDEMDEAMTRLPNPWGPFAMKWTRFIRTMLVNQAVEEGGPVGRFKAAMENVYKPFGVAMARCIQVQKEAKRQAEKQITEQYKKEVSPLEEEYTKNDRQMSVMRQEVQTISERVANNKQRYESGDAATQIQVRSEMESDLARLNEISAKAEELGKRQEAIDRKKSQAASKVNRAAQEIEEKYRAGGSHLNQVKDRFDNDYMNTHSNQRQLNHAIKNRMIKRVQEDPSLLFSVECRGGIPLGNGGNGEAGQAYLSRAPLTVRHTALSLGRARKPRSTEEGVFLRSPHRLAMDGRIFSRRMPKRGASILIDGSGSMQVTDKQIYEVVEAAGPDTIVALYFGRKRDGVIRIISKGMRRAEAEWMARQGGENIIDVPALQWLASQPKPRIWVSDGMVTGLGGERYLSVNRDCDAIRTKFEIERIHHMQAAIQRFEQMRREKGANRWSA